jgi:hypothetical protein
MQMQQQLVLGGQALENTEKQAAAEKRALQLKIEK